MKIKTRYFLSSKKIRQLTQEILNNYPFLNGELNYKNSKIELIETREKTSIYVVNGAVQWIKKEETLIPSILLLNNSNNLFPKIIIDMGAVPYIAKGADVMAPGVVSFPKDIKKNQITIVADEKYGKPLAVGKSLISGEEAKKTKKGKVVKVLHYVGDEIWELEKSLE